MTNRLNQISRETSYGTCKIKLEALQSLAYLVKDNHLQDLFLDRIQTVMDELAYLQQNELKSYDNENV